MKNVITILVTLVALTFAGCESKYRYHCQNPDNWESKECQKPFCEASGTCPEDLIGSRPNAALSEEIVLVESNCNCNEGE